jgi:hypothetical protein
MGGSEAYLWRARSIDAIESTGAGFADATFTM